MISNALEDKPLPIYGDGMQVRDWLYVDDHCRAIRAVLEQGREGEIYNIGGSRSLPNLDVVHKILAATGKTGKPDAHGRGSARARSPLCPFERQNHARDGLGSSRGDSKMGYGRRWNGIARIAGGWSASNRVSTPAITRATTKIATPSCGRWLNGHPENQ